MCSAHLIPVLEWLPALGVIGDQIPDLAVGIPVQEIEWTQVRSHRPKSIQALLSGTARRPLVRQDDPLGPIGQAHSGQQPGSRDRRAVLIELMTVDVDHRRGVSAQSTLFQPRLVAPRGQGVVVAAAPEVDAFDLANAELEAPFAGSAATS